MRIRFTLALLTLPLLAAVAKADRVHLVGGSVIEGKATREGNKVIVELESGRITLPADSVKSIDAAPTAFAQYEARLARIASKDTKALLELANYCRDHDMAAHERELLARIIEVEPDHAEARARLGYVRTGTGWITLDEQRKQQGLVLYAGQWVTREQMLELKRLEAQTDASRIAREKAELELESQRVALAQKREDAERERERDQADAEARRRAERDFSYGYFVPYYGYGYAYGGYGYVAGACQPGLACPHPKGPGYTGVGPYGAHPHGAPPPPFINGARDPRNMTFSLPGVRDPRSYF